MNLSLTFVLIICFGMICYSDFRWFIIPNIVTATIFFSGLLAQASDGWRSAAWAIVFASSVGLLMWSIRYAHFKTTGRLGLGFGDVKLAAAAAAWFSPWMFPFFLFLSSALALLFLIVTSPQRPALRTRKIPFGPFLAASLIVTWNLQPFILPIIGPSP